MNVKNTIKLQTYLELFEKSLQSIDKQESKIEHKWKNLMNEADKESEQINALSDVIQQVIFTNKLNNNLEEQQVLLQLLTIIKKSMLNYKIIKQSKFLPQVNKITFFSYLK